VKSAGGKITIPSDFSEIQKFRTSELQHSARSQQIEWMEWKISHDSK
jgi:hypothetical protein